LARVSAQLVGNFFLRQSLLFEANEFRDVFDAVDDMEDFSGGP
jgi:hypothetical protein